jgi:hypothetical protein
MSSDIHKSLSFYCQFMLFSGPEVLSDEADLTEEVNITIRVSYERKFTRPMLKIHDSMYLGSGLRTTLRKKES